MNMLGRCLERGWGCTADPANAATWYRAASITGDNWARYNLANMLMRGRGVPRQQHEAWRLFLAAAQDGHAKSMNLVARFLDEGWCVPQDRVAALSWYRRSAEAGDYRGQHNLATLLAEAGQVPDALAWWTRALPDATQDILQAMRETLALLPGGEAADLHRRVTERLLPLGQHPAGEKETIRTDRRRKSG